MILTIFWCILYAHKILSVYVFFLFLFQFKTVASLDFSSNPCFSEKMHIERGLEGQWRMSLCGIAP